MKTRLLSLFVLCLASCQIQPIQPAPRAYGVRPVAPITRGCRYTAFWGAPVVHWIDNLNGHRWTCTYGEFFRYCGGRHPNELGIAVKGTLPPEYRNLPKATPVAAGGQAIATTGEIPLVEPKSGAPLYAPPK